MNSKQAQLYEDLLDQFIEVDKHYSLTVQKMQVQGVKAEVLILVILIWLQRT
jgi:hypothetical protein